MKEKEDSRMTPYFTPYHHLLPVVFPLLFHLSMFLSTPQSITTLVPSTVGSSHSTTVIFSKHKSCQWVTIYYRKRTKLPYMVTSWSFLPPCLIMYLVPLLILCTPHILAFVRHLIIIPSTERTLCMRFSCLSPIH